MVAVPSQADLKKEIEELRQQLNTLSSQSALAIEELEQRVAKLEAK